MERSSLKITAAVMAIALLLAGCGSKAEDSSAAPTGQTGGTQAAADNAGGGTDQPPDRTADIFAKVVKVTSDSIVVQESKTPPSEMPGGGMRGGHGGGPRGGTQGSAHDGNTQPQGGGTAGYTGGQAGSGQASTAQAGDSGSGQPGTDGHGTGRPGGARYGTGRGGGGFGGMAFKDEQTSISITQDTEIESSSFGQNGRTTPRLEPSDLKAGDIITIWLDSDKKTAQYIMRRFNPGNFGKAGNRQ
jgi:hypothetical protein